MEEKKKAYKVCHVTLDGELESINHLVELKYEIGVEVKALAGSALFLFATLEDAIRGSDSFITHSKIFEVEYTPTTLDIRPAKHRHTLIPWSISAFSLDISHIIPNQPKISLFPRGTIFADSVTLLREV